MRFTTAQYDEAIASLIDAKSQLEPDGRCCAICHDSSHMAWECGHNPLHAMALCEGVARAAEDLHAQLHAIEDAMADIDVSDAIADWREDAHDLLHLLAGHDTAMGLLVGPARVALPDGDTTEAAR